MTFPRLLAVLVLAVCAGCSAPAAADSLSVALQFPPRAAYAFDADDGALLMTLGVAETLTTADANAQPAPGLATAWTQSGTTWRFTLRQGVTFHDGTPLTADAVVTALTYISGVSAPPRAIRGIGLTVKADGDAVVIGTTAPDPVLPLRLSSGNLGILASSAYVSGKQPAVVRTGTGPYVLTAATGSDTASLSRFDDYWGTPAGARTVTVRYVSDPQSRALALQSGDVQFAEGLPQASIAQVKGTGATTVGYPAARTIELLLNESAAPFSDKRVRQAVTAAIDRSVLASSVLSGAATAASDLFGPAVPWRSSSSVAGADVATAKRLLAAAGYDTLTVRLWTFPNRPEMPVLATAIQSMLAAVGITVEVTVGDYAAQEPKVLAGQFDMFLNSRSYLSDFADATGVLTSDYTCAGGYNIDHFCSAAFDDLVASLSTTGDVAARQKIFKQAAQVLTDEAVGVMIVHPNNTAGMRGATGFVPDPLGVRPVVPQLKPAG